MPEYHNDEQNISILIEFKKSVNLLESVLSQKRFELIEMKRFIFLGVSNNKQIFYKICDYMCNNNYTGFDIKNIDTIENNSIIETDIIVSIPGNIILTFNNLS